MTKPTLNDFAPQPQMAAATNSSNPDPWETTEASLPVINPPEVGEPIQALDDAGKSLMVNVNTIHIDPDYQRMTNEKRAQQIADEFSWAMFEAISVSLRDDGTLWCYNGGHRLRAAIIRGITYVPVRRHRLPGPTDEDRKAQEARLFKGMADTTKKILPYDRVKAGITGRDEIAIRLGNMYNEFGRKLYKGDCWGELITYMESPARHDDLYVAFQVINSLCGSNSIPAGLLRGLMWIENDMMHGHHLTEPKWRARIEHLGFEALNVALKEKRKKRGTNAIGERLAGFDLLDRINLNSKVSYETKNYKRSR